MRAGKWLEKTSNKVKSTNVIPTLADCRIMWSEVDFSTDTSACPRVAEFTSALAAVYTNGKVLHRAFKLPSHAVFDWYASRNKFHDMGFFEHFWLKSSVQSAIPQKLASLNFYSNDIFKWSNPFMLAGEFAWALASGGAYERHHAGSLDAKRIADAAAEELIQSEYDSSLLFTSHIAWSDFYCDVAWDGAWVLIHQSKRLVHVILATDTD